MQTQSLVSALMGTPLLYRASQGTHLLPPKELAFVKPAVVPARPHTAVMPMTCKLSHQEAHDLAGEALLNRPLPEHAAIMSRIESPEDIYVSGLATARLLSRLNADATDEEKKQNHLNALFLRDKIGQRVVNHALKTWPDRWHCLLRVIQTLPGEALQMLIPSKKPALDAAASPFSKQDAALLAQHFLRHQPLEQRDNLLGKIQTFDDLVALDREACRLLKQLNQDQPKAVRRENTMNYLFLMHHIGVQMTNRFIQTSADKRRYWQHLWETLKS